MQHLFLIAIGGAVGSVLRYLVSIGTHSLLGRDFPYGTLMVNVVGALFMGFLSTLLFMRFDGMGPELRSLVLIGFLGGFTTFSAFSIETFHLFENDMIKEGIINIILSIILCLLAVWLGTIVGRKI